MNEMTVAEAFASNDKVHEKLKALVGNLTSEQVSQRCASQDNWSVADIVEHVSIVEAGIAGLCSKLLQRAKDDAKTSDGRIRLSDAFLVGGEKSMSEKWQAPERVRPTGTKTIEESFAVMADSRTKLEQLRPLFEQYSSSEATFPHPFLGELTAAEWLCLIGGHGVRHMRQIKRILDPSSE